MATNSLPQTSFRPAVRGAEFMVASTHYLATLAGIRMLQNGGNAFDAAVATGITIGVVERDLVDFGGVAPIILYEARTGRVHTISGLGRASQTVTLESYLARFGGDMPRGIPRSVVPAAPDAWITLLDRFGKLPFAEVAQPAIEICARGFPVFPRLHVHLKAAVESLRAWPSSGAVYMPGGRIPEIGELLVQTDLANTLRALADAERAAAAKGGRHAGLMAAHDLFYKGDLADIMVRFCQENGGFLTRRDFADSHVQLEEPARSTYKSYDVYACGPWCQGPVVPYVLNLLEGIDLKGSGHNSADYCHAIVEAFKLAFADRERYIADPEFADVPLAGMLSKSYADERRTQIDRSQAWPELPPHGDPWPHQGRSARGAGVVGGLADREGPPAPDTGYLCAVDREGNAVSSTPSDACVSTNTGGPVVPGLGHQISPRGSQFWLDPAHPCVIAPWKRPRLTPNPALVLKDSRPFLAWGTPGGDGQPQAMVQVFLNIVEWGMNPQEAIEQPRVLARSFPDSFWPHTYPPGKLQVEEGIPPAVRDDLSRRGHRIEVLPSWTEEGCGVNAIQVDRAHGTLVGGADPRRECYAIGW
ncbi:MAG: gamma-glutamyltransferase family protein [Chloroflexi bacterium]|nr:gamma-glutamyltransferase family protein [Chloroflexota bacterium]